jgi:ChrB-like protein
MLNGTWVLPQTVAHTRLFEELRRAAGEQGGRALVLAVQETPPDTERAIMDRFRADRGREYDEFAERCAAFRAEVRKETRARKFTFAELEEGEHDLEKLLRWLAKISARDFFPDERAAQARELAQGCQRALEDFSLLVYQAEGIEQP